MGKTPRLGSSGETEAEFPLSNPRAPPAQYFPLRVREGDIGIGPFRPRPGRPARARPGDRLRRRLLQPGVISAWARAQAWLWDPDGVTFPSGRGALPAAELPVFPSRVGGSRWHPPLRPEPRGTRAILKAGVLALAGTVGLAPGSFPAPFAFLTGGGMSVPGPVSLALGPKSPNQFPMTVSLSLPHGWESDGPSRVLRAASLGVQSAGGLSPGHPEARAPPKSQDFGAGRASRGSSKLSSCRPGAYREQPGRAQPGHPLTWGGPPAPKKGVRLPQLEAALSQAQPLGSPRWRWGGRGMEGPKTPGKAKGHPACPQTPGQGIRTRHLGLRGCRDAALPMLLLFCSPSHLLFRIN